MRIIVMFRVENAKLLILSEPVPIIRVKTDLTGPKTCEVSVKKSPPEIPEGF